MAVDRTSHGTSDLQQFLGAVGAVALVFAVVAGSVHYFFQDSALAAAIGFGIPLILGVGFKFLAK
jgi:hypothetical protein